LVVLGLNTGPHICKAGALTPPAPSSSRYFEDRVSIFAQAGLDLDPSVLGFPLQLG
jgi:hypothetical protein